MPRSLIILFLASSILPIATVLLIKNDDAALVTSEASFSNGSSRPETASKAISGQITIETPQTLPESITKNIILGAQTDDRDELLPTEISLDQEEPLLLGIVSSLEIEQGMSDHNLMLLREISSRLASNETQTLPEGLPPAFQQTLSAMLKAELRDQELLQAWSKEGAGDITSLQKALSEQRKQILGASLYERLYSEDKLMVSQDGYSAEYAPQTQNEGENSESTYSSTPTANAVTTETHSYEIEWQRRLLLFLDEYQYVEQAGLTDEDERLMRSELLERHFEPEDFEIVNQFIFKNQATNVTSSRSINAEL